MTRLPREYERLARLLAESPPQLMTDFEQMLEDAALAHEMVPTNEPSAELVEHAHRRLLKQQREGQDRFARGHLRTSPESFDDATMGRVTTIKYNPSPADQANNIKSSDTIINWQGEKPEAQAGTIDLSIFDTSRTTGMVSRPFAQVTFGVDGFRTQAISVDIPTRFTITANYVTVLVSMDPNPAGTLSGILQVGGSFAPFAAPSILPVKRTIYLDSLPQYGGVGTGALGQSLPQVGGPQDGVGQLTFVLPDHSIFALPPTGPLGSAIQYDFLDYAGYYIGSMAYPIGQWPLQLPIPSDSRMVRITNLVGGTAGFRCPFGLAL